MIQRNIQALFVALFAMGSMACGVQVRSGGSDAEGSGAGGSGTAGSGTGGTSGNEGCATCGINEECDGNDHCIEVLAAGLNAPQSIAVDSANVYWMSGGNGTGIGMVMKCAATGCGGAPTLLASGTLNADDMALDATHVYWKGQGMDSIVGAVVKCGIDGCAGTPEILLSKFNPSDLEVQDGQLYMAENTPQPTGAGRLLRCPTSGCSDTPIEFAKVNGVPTGFAVNGTHVAWGGSVAVVGAPSTVMTCDSTACTPTPLTSATTVGALNITMDAENVYWTNEDFSIMKCPRTGCADLIPITMASFGLGSDIPYAIATDGVNVYWTIIAMGGTPAVMKCPVDGCENGPITVAMGPKIQHPLGIAVDATHVYWTDFLAGTVMRARK